MDKWMNGQTDWYFNEWTNGQTDWCINEWTNGPTDWQLDEWTNGLIVNRYECLPGEQEIHLHPFSGSFPASHHWQDLQPRSL